MKDSPPQYPENHRYNQHSHVNHNEQDNFGITPVIPLFFMVIVLIIGSFIYLQIDISNYDKTKRMAKDLQKFYNEVITLKEQNNEMDNILILIQDNKIKQNKLKKFVKYFNQSKNYKKLIVDDKLTFSEFNSLFRHLSDKYTHKPLYFAHSYFYIKNMREFVELKDFYTYININKIYNNSDNIFDLMEKDKQHTLKDLVNFFNKSIEYQELTDDKKFTFSEFNSLFSDEISEINKSQR